MQDPVQGFKILHIGNYKFDLVKPLTIDGKPFEMKQETDDDKKNNNKRAKSIKSLQDSNESSVITNTIEFLGNKDDGKNTFKEMKTKLCTYLISILECDEGILEFTKRALTKGYTKYGTGNEFLSNGINSQTKKFSDLVKSDLSSLKKKYQRLCDIL